MKKLFIFILFITILVQFIPAEGISSDLPNPLNLKDCIDLALKNNPNLKIAEKRIITANSRIAELRSLIMPQVNGNLMINTRNNDMGSNVSGRSMVVSDQTIGTGKVSVIVPIYDFGISTNAYKSMELLSHAADFDAGKVRLDMEFSVTQVYFQLLESQKVAEVIKKSVTILDNQLKIANDFFAQGLVAANDLFSARVQLLVRRQELSRAENNILLTQAALNNLIGLEITQDIKIVEPPSLTTAHSPDCKVSREMKRSIIKFMEVIYVF